MGEDLFDEVEAMSFGFITTSVEHADDCYQSTRIRFVVDQRLSDILIDIE